MSNLFSIRMPSAPLAPAVQRVNVTEPYSVTQWSTSLGCSKSELRAAVDVVGNVVADIEEHLQRQGAQLESGRVDAFLAISGTALGIARPSTS